MRAIATQPHPVQSHDVRDYAGAVLLTRTYQAGPGGEVVAYQTHAGQLDQRQLRDLLTAVLHDLGGPTR